MIIYLSGPHFSLAERTFNEEFAASLERNFFPSHVIVPQLRAGSQLDAHHGACENGDITHLPVRPLGAPHKWVMSPFSHAIDAIERCDAVVAILDGADAEAETCVALGYAKAKNKTVIGIRTDFRQGEDRGLNLMVSNICTHLIVRPSTSVTLDELADEVAAILTLTLRTDAATLTRSIGEEVSIR